MVEQKGCVSHFSQHKKYFANNYEVKDNADSLGVVKINIDPHNDVLYVSDRLSNSGTTSILSEVRDSATGSAQASSRDHSVFKGRPHPSTC